MRRLAVFAMVLMLASPAPAQEAAPTEPVRVAPPVLIVDSERLFAQSSYAASLRAAVEEEAAALATENARIVADLTEEEKSLTERRPGMLPEDFRREAAAFDAKVQEIRRARDAKEAELTQKRLDLRVQFFDEVRPLVGRMMVDQGALVVLDSRSVFVAVRAVDVTDAAVTMIDEALLTP